MKQAIIFIVGVFVVFIVVWFGFQHKHTTYNTKSTVVKVEFMMDSPQTIIFKSEYGEQRIKGRIVSKSIDGSLGINIRGGYYRDMLDFSLREDEIIAIFTDAKPNAQ